jgi:hypothetical protein
MSYFFEHIAFVVHADDLSAWQQLLLAQLGGGRGLGGDQPNIGFRGGQIEYPDAGMLEILTWDDGADASNGMRRYLARAGGRAAMHHMTFVVDDIEAQLERAESMGLEPMKGRFKGNWKEFFVRAGFLRPRRMLIQVLQVDKEDVERRGHGGSEWAGFEPGLASHPNPVRIAGMRVATDDVERAKFVFGGLLGAEIDDGEGADTVTLSWPSSTMRIVLVPGGDVSDTRVELSSAPGEASDDLHERLQAPGIPRESSALMAPSAGR